MSISAANKRRPTIADVARVAQVSKTTVSRVLNNKPDVDSATVASVLEVMRRLGYVPSSQAVGLARGSASSLGLLAPSMSAPWMLEVLRGVSEAMETSGYSLTLYTMAHGRDSLDALQARLRSDALDGLAVMQPPRDADDLRRLLAIETPMVAIDDRGAHPSLTSVSSADDQGIREAVMHLASIGRLRLAMLAGPTHIPCHGDRLAAFRSAVSDAGLVSEQRLHVVAPEDTFNAGAATAAEMIERGLDFDGLVVGNDAMALGALRALKRAGIAVPGDVAVTGFDDVTAARYSDPPLTTVYNPLYEMGRTAAELLLAAAGGKGLPDGPVLLPTRLVVRGSTDASSAQPDDDLTHWRAQALDLPARLDPIGRAPSSPVPETHG